MTDTKKAQQVFESMDDGPVVYKPRWWQFGFKEIRQKELDRLRKAVDITYTPHIPTHFRVEVEPAKGRRCCRQAKAAIFFFDKPLVEGFDDKLKYAFTVCRRCGDVGGY